MEPTETKHNNIDSSVFDSPNDESKADIFIKRLTTALKYYSQLDIINNNKHKDLFINFIQQKYTQLIDDFTLLTKQNKEKLYSIQQLLIKNEDFKICDIKKCNFSTRHSNEINENIQMDPILNFYKITMDSLHFYIFHLFDCGMRTIILNDNENQIKEEKKDSEYFDADFARINSIINDRKHITQSFARFRNNNKFNINVGKMDKKNESDVVSNGIYIFYNLFVTYKYKYKYK